MEPQILNIRNSFYVNGNAQIQVTTQAKGSPLNLSALDDKTNPSILTITVTTTTENSDTEKKFLRLAQQWRKETRLLSSVSKKSMHPAYQQIIGLGEEVLPFIFRDLRQTRGHWLWALFAITGEDPASEGCTFTEAVDAWLEWGARKGYGSFD